MSGTFWWTIDSVHFDNGKTQWNLLPLLSSCVCKESSPQHHLLIPAISAQYTTRPCVCVWSRKKPLIVGPSLAISVLTLKLWDLLTMDTLSPYREVSPRTKTLLAMSIFNKSHTHTNTRIGIFPHTQSPSPKNINSTMQLMVAGPVYTRDLTLFSTTLLNSIPNVGW